MMSKVLPGKRLVMILASMALLVALAPATAQASNLTAATPEPADTGSTLATQAITKKTLKPIYDSDSIAAQLKKSTLIKKKGTYALTLKNGAGIVRFKSPKTKTYSFTFSKLKSGQADSVACIIGFCKANSKSYAYQTIKTKEGKRPRAILLTPNLTSGNSVTFDGYSYLRTATRTAKIKVKKGASIYIAMMARDMDNDPVRSAMRLKIS